MVMVNSTMPGLGTQAPDFRLPDTQGKLVSLSDFAQAKGILVAFICNHCPFVKHVRAGLVHTAKSFQDRGIAVVAVNSKNNERYPDEAPEKMKVEVQEAGYTFPYLYDESQEVAKTYGAACTPDFFLYDSRRRLFYRGQLDGSRPGNNRPVTGEDLMQAADALLQGKPAPERQMPSAGCNIKWKPGKEPAYFRS